MIDTFWARKLSDTMKIVITGGGTGGHVFPALAVAEELRHRGFSVLYVGSSQGLEAKLVPEKGFPFFCVKTGAVKNQKSFRIFLNLFRLVGGIFWAIGFLWKHRPRAVLGVGGYISVPTCVAAFVLRIRVYLQEQNVSVGIANRFLGKLATRVFIGFEQATSSFPEKKCMVTGNPLRREFYLPGFPELVPNSRDILIVGGSQGAHAINNLILTLLSKIEAEYPNTKIVHQTGQADFDHVRGAYAKTYRGPFEVLPFITDMLDAYAKATLVISRSGALASSELLAVKRPSILIPYPRRGQNDQTANARFLEKKGVAVVVEQGKDFESRFWGSFTATFTPETLAKMGQSFSGLRVQNALVSIGDQIAKDLNVQEN